MYIPNENNLSFLAEKKLIIVLIFSSAAVLGFIIYLFTKSKNHSTVLIKENDYIILRQIERKNLFFTQGLLFDEQGYMIESTGLYGESTLLKYSLDAPDRPFINQSMSSGVFAEGAALVNGSLFQLTWREKLIFKYSIQTNKFDLTKTYPLPAEISEGWGLTYDGSSLIVSDGSNSLYFVNPDSLNVTKRVKVHEEDGSPINELNELEYINGTVFANVWYSKLILKIDPNSGKVLKKYDFTSLYNHEQNFVEFNLSSLGYVLNGIAYEPQNKTLVLTGKKWRHLYVVELL